MTYVADCTFVARVSESVKAAVSWVKTHRYRAYEPADGNSSVLFPLTGGRILPMRVLQQIVLRAPFNIRRLIGVRPHESAIGRGYMAWGYVLLERTGVLTARSDAVECLDWLIENRSAGSQHFCWGDPYDYATRSGRRPCGAPLLIWSALIGHAFLDAYRLFDEPRYLDVARSIASWILSLPREMSDRGACLSYVAYRQSSIHNSNITGAGFLAEVASITGDPYAMQVAGDAALYTCARQRSDGAWYYAEESKYHWIDGFHTGYNLSALKRYRAATGDSRFDGHYLRGIDFYRRHFFEPDGCPKYFHNARRPVDVQCAAQGIETLAAVSDDVPDCLPLAIRIADWTMRHMQAPDGHFYYRDVGWTKVRTPMLHWGQATMVKALVQLVAVLPEKVTIDEPEIRSDYACME
jgi:rhamnogalacturonyl hydrolase YesR